MPALRSSAAQASPAGPAPTIATRFPVGAPGTKNGVPASRWASIATRCSAPIAIGRSIGPRTQAPSHRLSTGQTRAHVPPSGLAARIVRALPPRLPVRIAWMKPGTSIPVGQARTQGAS